MIEAGVVTTGSDGIATITFRTPRPYKPRVLVSCEADDCVAMILDFQTSGGLYVSCRVKAYAVRNSRSLSTTTVVTGVSTSSETVVGSVSTTPKSVVGSVSTSSETVVGSVSTTPETVVGDISTSTASAVTSIPSTTGDAHGRYSVDGSGYVHHDHAIGSPSTSSFVTSVSKTTKTVVGSVSTTPKSVVGSVSTSSETVVGSVSTTPKSVVGSVSPSTGSAVSDVTLGLTPRGSVSVMYVVV